MKTDLLYIDQILDSVRKIELYMSGYNKDKFFADSKTQSSVILQLTLIGEISKKISDEVKSQIALPWKDITGFRDRAIHNYFDINLDVIFETINQDIPIVKQKLSEYKTKQ